MSAESPHRARASVGPATVAPQQVTDPTILDSVAGFINEVVPTAYNAPSDIDDVVQWAHFEQPSRERDGDDSLVLVLGYTNGIQIWAIPATGEATEILSWRHSTLRVLRLLPTPFKTAPETSIDLFASARPLMALCDSTANYSTLSFRSLKSAIVDPVKQIQFKTSILNVYANQRSVIVSFAEKIAVFDAFTLESRVSITTCYLSPGIQANPVALGSRWLAYAEKRINPGCASFGGMSGNSSQGYAASVMNVAKNIGRNVLGAAATLAGGKAGGNGSPQAGAADGPDKGIVTVLDIENKNLSSRDNLIPQDAVIAHFVAHEEAIVCMSFDPTGTLLLTADRSGRTFHVFRLQSEWSSAAQAAVQHLYTLRRGDTSAKVQDMCFSPDSRWVAVSTLRGTTHVFPITPYGGNISVRTHATPHVVNKMSRYQRSAGLLSDSGRSSSPVSSCEAPATSLYPYRNPRYPPHPVPTLVNPLAQIRQPVYVQSTGTAPQRAGTRQRLTSSSEENITLRVVACFAPPRAWMETPKTAREVVTHKPYAKPVESLFVVSCYGTLVQYDLDPHPTSATPREKVCNDSCVELRVQARAQWLLHRHSGADVPLPMAEENLNLIGYGNTVLKKDKADRNEDQWLSQVEIVTHLGPHRRLWMGPQFTFKTYTVTNGMVLETRPLDVRRSKPVNMPVSKANAILIESGSASSCEQLFLDTYHKANEEVGNVGDSRLKEDLADAMLESPIIRDAGGRCVIVSMKPHSASATVAKVVNPLGTVVTVQSDDEPTAETEDVVVIHENCDEALFRPVVTTKAVFYSEARPRACPPDNILTKSLEANTEVAVKIINRSPPKKAQEENHAIVREKNNKVVSSMRLSISRECSPKRRSKENVVDNKIEKVRIEKVSSTNKSKAENRSKIKVASVKKEEKGPDHFRPFSSEPVIIVDTVAPPPPPEFAVEDLSQQLDFPAFDSILKFADAEDWTIEKPIVVPPEQEVTKKVRKPKTKLGVKITKEKDSNSENEEPNIGWSVLESTPILDFDLGEFETVEPSIEEKDPNVDSLIELDPVIEIEEIKVVAPKSDEEEIGKGEKVFDETTESDDSGRNTLAVDDITAPVQNLQSSSKSSSKKKPKKKRDVVDLGGKEVEDVSSASSFSSASRASPTPSFSDNFLHFPGDSSSSM